MNFWHYGFLSFGIALTLAGCGSAIHPSGPSPHFGQPQSMAAPRPMPTSPSLVWEPGVGVTPCVRLIDQALTGIDLNAYPIDNPAILTALRQAGQRGVPIHVLLAPNPYGDAGAVSTERQALATIPHCLVRSAPPRFAAANAYDHAKYLVINPGTPQATAVIGTANLTDSAFDGGNLEAVAVATGAPAQAATQVFQADWTDRPSGPGPRRALVLSPGAAPAITSLLRASGPIQMMTEEVGDDPALLAIMAADGARLQLLVPPTTSTTTTARLAALAAAGVHIRTLSTPDIHAKVIVMSTTAFLGSQNLSAVSLQDNPEMGLLFTGSAWA